MLWVVLAQSANHSVPWSRLVDHSRRVPVIKQAQSLLRRTASKAQSKDEHGTGQDHKPKGTHRDKPQAQPLGKVLALFPMASMPECLKCRVGLRPEPEEKRHRTESHQRQKQREQAEQPEQPEERYSSQQTCAVTGSTRGTLKGFSVLF